MNVFKGCALTSSLRSIARLSTSTRNSGVDHAKSSLRQADAVCFDVDSTVLSEEGVDVLADFLGKGPEIAAWTAKAMDGNVTFQEALHGKYRDFF